MFRQIVSGGPQLQLMVMWQLPPLAHVLLGMQGQLTARAPQRQLQLTQLAASRQ